MTTTTRYVVAGYDDMRDRRKRHVAVLDTVEGKKIKRFRDDEVGVKKAIELRNKMNARETTA